MYKPSNWDEYLDLVHQAVDEIDEMRARIDEDAELYAQFIEPLDAFLRELFEDMISGRYQFPSDTDLPYMAVVKRFGRAIPFRLLLETINLTHRSGL